MGRSAYWNAGSDSLASVALGDANRGAFLALQSAVSTRRRPVATDPPERRASSSTHAPRRPSRDAGDGLLPVLSAAEKGRCYRDLRLGPAGFACVASGLLRGSRARRRAGGASAVPLWSAGL